MTVLRWEAPPTIPARACWKLTAAELKQNPGVWALVLEGARASYVYGSATRALKSYGCETTAMKTDGGHSVWARFVNPPVGTTEP